MNQSNDQSLREHIVSLLAGGNAHITLDDFARDFPAEKCGEKVPGLPYTAWQVLEHMRIAQWDILEFSRNPQHVSPKWPEGYWPKPEEVGNSELWQQSLERFRADLKEMEDLINDSATDLFAPYNVVDHTENVEVRTLDSVIEELRARMDIGKNLYLKMDTQGYDLEVLKGAEHSLAMIAAVQTELSCLALYKNMPGYVEMLAALDQKGFQLSGMFPVNQDTSLRIIESDCVMLNSALVKSAGNRLMWTM